jgi:hypothetical protein
MTYNGVVYSYAFEFDVSVSYKSTNENFRIAVSKFREETHDFSGLCLENELTVISDEKTPFMAFVDIIDSTIDITTSSIIAYANAHGGCIPKPHRQVKCEEFINKFNEFRISKESVLYMERLKNYYEQLESKNILLDDVSKELKPDFNNYVYLTFLHVLLCTRIPKINHMRLFPI